MSHAPEKNNQNGSTYVLATGNAAAERLKIQHKLCSQNSYDHLEKAKLSEGKIVWDIGCGSGAMTRYLAHKVGRSGHVYALDANEEQLIVAEKLIKSEKLTNVTFICGDITSLEHLPKEQADIVYMRFVLMHLKNPQAGIERIKPLLKQGGVCASQESIMRTTFSRIHGDIIRDYTNSLIALGDHKGVNYNIGDRIHELYKNADYDRVDTYYEQPMISLGDAQSLLLMGLAEWGDKAIDAGVATQIQINLWTRIIENFPEYGQGLDFAFAKQAYTLAWK
jgi:ubiquinone/menaquinone biosynthesis C-methylase UbiE